MAVVDNFWLRDTKQRLGGAVLYQVNGQTLSRKLAATIRNPRTTAQMETRVKLANLVAFYRMSSGWMRGAFETKRKTQSDYNAFVAANAAANNVWLTKQQVDAGNCVVAPYVISRGSLGEIRQTQSSNSITSNLYAGELTIDASTTIAQFSAALIANNNGLQSGDQLSIVQYIQNTNTSGSYSVVCRSYEIVLNPDNATLLSDYVPIELLGVSTGDTPALRILTASFVGGAAFILSRSQGGRILVSSSNVTLTYNNAVYAAMTTSSQKDAAVKSYGTSNVTFLDPNLAASITGEVTTAFNILNVRIDGIAYNPGDALPQEINEQTPVIVNLSAALENPQILYLAFLDASGELVVGLTNTTPSSAGTTSQLTATPEETASFEDSATYRLAIFSDEEYQNMITYVDFAKYSSSGEGLG